MYKLISLARHYDLVVNDRFELFYRGVIRHLNPYKFYIHISCDKGNYYPRYYTFTPKDSDVGDYKLVLSLYDDYHNLVEQAETTLHVVKPEKAKRKLNILCFGDSLTCNGVWPHTAYVRYTKDLGFDNSLNMLGHMKNEEVGYEGYGGWKWSEFCTDNFVGIGSSVWITCKHNFNENDQHSVWLCNDKKWVLETILEDKVKFKPGAGNFVMNKCAVEKFTHFEGGIHKDEIIATKYEYEASSPFYDKTLDGPNFKMYCDKYGYGDLDFVYILLSWNGQWRPYNEDFSDHEPYIKKILNQIHKDYPKCHIGLLGIQSCAINGGISANYGCTGAYSDTLGEVVTAYNYDEYLEKLTQSDEYKDFTSYIDTKAQFDVEHSTPAIEVKVNNRSNVTELIGTNGVHPTMEGYLQIGDAFYRALVSDIKDFNERN